jgi:undecaprenyl-diphosphatase
VAIVYSNHLDKNVPRPAQPRLARPAVTALLQNPNRRCALIALSVAALGALGFARVAEDYLTNDPLARWDVSFARWLSGERITALTDAFRVVTFIGSPAVALALVTAACVVLYRGRSLLDALLLPLVLGGAEALNLILKLSFHRARPEVAFVNLDTYSFPSGHAMISTAAYGALAYLAWGRLNTHRTRYLLITGTAALLIAICFSRLYLGVHYLSDVLAGFAGGVFWLATSIGFIALFGASLASRFDGSRLDSIGRRLTRS